MRSRRGPLFYRVCTGSRLRSRRTVDDSLVFEAYRVVAIRGAEGIEDAPAEIAQRFSGRLFTLQQLETRGVRIAGRNVWYLAAGRDWQLTLARVATDRRP